MLMLKLTQYGTTLQIIINFEDVMAMRQEIDNATKIFMRGYEFFVNESIEMIAETVLGIYRGDNTFRSN